MLDSLVKALRPYDGKNLLSKVGALHLLPENAGRAISLEVLAHAAAAVPWSSGKGKIAPHRLRTVISQHLASGSSPAMADDPAEELFTEEIIAPGGPYLVLTGPNSQAADITRWFLKCIALRPDPVGSPALRDQMLATALACLKISHRIATNADLRRGMEPGSGRDLTVPGLQTLEKLARAVHFTSDEVSALLSSLPTGASVLDPLTMEAGGFDPSSYDITAPQLTRTPLVRCGDEFVVPEPSSLLPALRHRILALAHEAGMLADVVSAFEEAIWDEVLRLLEHWDANPIPVTLPDPGSIRFRESLRTLDSDKALYVQLVVDPLDGFTLQSGSPEWDVNGLADELKNRRDEVVEFLMSQDQRPRQIMCLTLGQHLGRPLIFGLDRPPHGALQLIMTPSDFKAVTLLDAGDPLALWKFAKASEEIRDRVEIFAATFLDEYALYRQKARSYYVSDETLPNLMMIAPGMGLEIRKRVQEQLDPHGIPSSTRGRLAEVVSFYGKGLPLYVSRAELGTRSCLAVEGRLPIPVWVVGPPDLTGSLYSFTAQLVETIAYWIWQFDRLLHEPLKMANLSATRVVIFLEYDEVERWDRLLKEEGEGGGDSPLVTVLTADAEAGELRLRVEPSVLPKLGTFDNAGERELIIAVIRSVRAMLSSVDSRTLDMLSEERLSQAVEEYAPLGLKKKLLMLPLGNRPELDRRGLPRYRSVQDADTAEIFDALGQYLRGKGWQEGPIRTKMDREKILNEAVTYLFDELERAVSELPGDQLLESLIAQHESATREETFRFLTIPTRLACFGQHDDLVRDLSKQIPEVALANLANRFLVEYVAARPPGGQRPLSLEAYDRLLALAAGIVNWGSFSDLIHFELADVPITMLPSGRLGTDREELEAQQNQFLRQHVAGEISRGRRRFAEHWGLLKPSEPAEDTLISDQLLDDLDHAVSAELGVGLREASDALLVLYSMGEERDHVVKRETVTAVRQRLQGSFHWDAQKVDAFLREFTLQPRDRFLEPTEHRQEEVYPWRYNRALSYMRLPLVFKDKGGEQLIVWGNRHLFLSARQFLVLFTSGRFKAKTTGLLKAIGSIRKIFARQFEDEVAAIIQGDPGLVVRKRIEKFGKARMIDPSGETLGDIDVLVAIPHRHLLVLIECKDFEFARTPREIQNQLIEVFKGSSGSRSVIDKHQRRVAWVEGHLPEVLAELGLPIDGEWRVTSRLVSDSEMYSSYIGTSPIDVAPIEELRSATLERLVENRV